MNLPIRPMLCRECRRWFLIDKGRKFISICKDCRRKRVQSAVVAVKCQLRRA